MVFRNVLFILSLTACISGCSGDKTIYIKTQDAYGIGPKTKILFHGAEIGEITDLEIVQDGIVFEVSILPNVRLPKDSKCFIEKRDLFTEAVAIKKGKRKQFLAEGDTLYFMPVQAKPDFTIDDETLEKAEEFLKEATGINQRDSMIRQLDRLNRNLEEIDQEMKRLTPEKGH